MKIRFIFAMILLMQLPLFVFAKTDVVEVQEKVVSSNTKYYKTITTLDNTYNIESLFISNNLHTKTIEVSEEEYNNSDILYNTDSSSTIQTNYKKLTITILEYGNKYKYIATLEWKNMPAVRSYDILGISFYNSVKANSIFYETYYCLNNGNCNSDNQYTVVNDTSGVGVVFQLPTSSNMTALINTLTVIVDKNTSGTIKEQKALADYSHAIKTISLNNAKNFSMSLSGGIVLSSSVETYYDEISPVATTLSCNW